MEALTCIVVLNWNGAEETLACLESLAPLLVKGYKILVVDNGSTDGSPEKIRKAFPAVEQLRLPANLGYAGGNNAGFRRVQELQAEFVIFLNNDTIVEPGFSAPLVETLRLQPLAGIAVPKIYYWDRPDLLWYAGGVFRLSTGLICHVGLRQKDSPEFDRPGSTGYATGCCFAMRCRDFEEVGGFDESFAMYAEDVDLSLRVRALGKSIEYVPSSRVWHKVSASLTGRPFLKLVKKSLGALRLFSKQRAWSGMVLYLLLLPLRLLGSFLKQWFSGRSYAE
ncbi:MAG: glycosyltransferase family 2 protein [Chlorobium sp.]|nr:glycosyltransferase family 2 protein [Chlorobium sp.]